MALFSIQLSQWAEGQVVGLFKAGIEQELELQRAILDRLNALIAKQGADSELAAAAREAKSVIDEIADTLNQFTP